MKCRVINVLKVKTPTGEQTFSPGEVIDIKSLLTAIDLINMGKVFHPCCEQLSVCSLKEKTTVFVFTEIKEQQRVIEVAAAYGFCRPCGFEPCITSYDGCCDKWIVKTYPGLEDTAYKHQSWCTATNAWCWEAAIYAPVTPAEVEKAFKEAINKLKP